MSDEITEKIMAMVAQICQTNVAHLTHGGNLLDYGLDSVGVLELMTHIEDEFDLEIDEHDPLFGQANTISDLVDYVERLRRG